MCRYRPSWRMQGYGPPARRMGKHVRYRPGDVIAWLDQLGDGAACCHAHRFLSEPTGRSRPGKWARFGWRARSSAASTDCARLVKRSGKTKAAAERTLRAALVKQLAPVKQSIITAQTTIEKVAELWLAEIEQAVNSGSKSPSTLDAYRTIYHRHVRPALGAPRVREVDTPAVDRYWQQSRSKPSAERGQRRL